jgi:hypothetical protein
MRPPLRRRSGWICGVACAASACGGDPPRNETTPVSLAVSAVPADTPGPDACAAWPLGPRCIRALRALGDRTCALTTRSAFCWGPQKGASPAQPQGIVELSLQDVERQGFKGAARKVDRPSLACEIDADSRLFCKGKSESYVLSDKVDKSKGMAFPVGFTPRAIAMGESSVCMSGEGSRGGPLMCIGTNDFGQLGRHLSPSYLRELKPVEGIPPVVDFAMGDHHVCVLSKEGEVWCWGKIAALPDDAPKRPPVQVVESSFGDTSYLRTEDGHIYEGRPMMRDGFSMLRDVSGVAEIGIASKCMRMKSGSVSCFGRPAGFSAKAVRLLDRIECAWLENDTIECRPRDSAAAPAPIVPADPIRAVGTDEWGTIGCLLTARGQVQCWGEIGFQWKASPGEADFPFNRDLQETSSAVTLKSLKDIVELSYRSLCVRAADGRVHAIETIGTAKVQKLGSVTHPNAVGAAALIDGNVCGARRADGSVFLMHQPEPAAFAPRASPKPTYVEVPALHGAEQLDVSRDLACARFQDGHASCAILPESAAWDDDAARVAQASFSVPLGTGRVRSVMLDRGDIACALPEQGGLPCLFLYQGKITEVGDRLGQGSDQPLKILPRE